MTLTSFSRSHQHFECQILTKKKLVCTLSLEPNNEFKPNIMYCIIGIDKRIIFEWPWPNFQGHHTIKTVKMSPVCTLISWTNWWIFTKLTQKRHWDMGKKWLDFGDIDIQYQTSTLNVKFWPKQTCLHPISWTKWWILAKPYVLCL